MLAILPCTFWLLEALLRLGRRELGLAGLAHAVLEVQKALDSS